MKSDYIALNFGSLKDPVIRKMLQAALATHDELELPMHKRGKKNDPNPDAATEEQESENDKLVELHQTRGAPAPIPVTDEDLREEVSDKLMSKVKKGKK
jgi:hypothetical protein